MPTIKSERLFQHSVKTVYNAFTDPLSLAKWWGPNGFTNRFESFEFTPGGHWIFDMIDENGKAYANHGVFQEIIPCELISWTRLSQPIFDMKLTYESVGSDKCLFAFHMNITDQRLYDTFMTFAPEKNEENFDRLDALLSSAT